MRLLTAVLLSTLFVSGFVILPTSTAINVSDNAGSDATQMVQKSGTPQHRGSGRRELINFAEVTIS